MKVHAKNLVKVIRTGEVKGRRRPPTLGIFPSSSAIKIVLLKQVVLIMQIINEIINADNFRQERSSEGPTLKLNKRFK